MKHPTPEMTHSIPHRRGVSSGHSASGTWAVGSPSGCSGCPERDPGRRDELRAFPDHERKAGVIFRNASELTRRAPGRARRAHPQLKGTGRV